jgi:hypothetical protein
VDTLRACFTGDFVLLDRRIASPRGDTHGFDAYYQTVLAMLRVADDVRMRCHSLVDGGQFGLILACYTGHFNETGGPFEVAVLVVSRLAGDRIDDCEIYDPEREPAALDRLLELQPDPALRAAWKPQLDALNNDNPDPLFAQAYVALPPGRHSIELLSATRSRCTSTPTHPPSSPRSSSPSTTG